MHVYVPLGQRLWTMIKRTLMMLCTVIPTSFLLRIAEYRLNIISELTVVPCDHWVRQLLPKRKFSCFSAVDEQHSRYAPPNMSFSDQYPSKCINMYINEICLHKAAYVSCTASNRNNKTRSHYTENRMSSQTFVIDSHPAGMSWRDVEFWVGNEQL